MRKKPKRFDPGSKWVRYDSQRCLWIPSRKKSIDVDQVCKLSDEGMGATAISKLMGISRKSVYNSLS